MLETLKKIFTIKNPSLYDKSSLKYFLQQMLEYKDLNSLFLSPVNKLAILNTYTVNSEEFLYNMYNQKFTRNSLCAVNLYSYFSTNPDVYRFFSTVSNHIDKTKLSSAIEHDLHELYGVFVLLRKLESSNES